MAVQGIHRDIRLRALEPLVMHAIPVQNLFPRTRPDEFPGVVAPEGFGVFDGAAMLLRPILLPAGLSDDRWRGVLLVNRQQVGNVLSGFLDRAAHRASGSC